MKKYFGALSISLLLTTGCPQSDGLDALDQGGDRDLSSDDLGSGDLPDGGGADAGQDAGFDVLQPGLNLFAGHLGGDGNIDGTGTAARFHTPSAVATDGLGNLYVADGANNVLRKIVLASGAVTTLNSTVNDSFGIAADGAGNVYYSDSGTFAIHKLVVATGTVTTLAGGGNGSADGVGTAARFNYPMGLGLDGAGNLFVADAHNHTIRQIVIATGTVTTLAGTAGMVGGADGAGAAARFQNPSGLAADTSGNVYVADTYNSSVRRIVVSTGAVTTLAGMSGTPGTSDGIGAAARFRMPYDVTVDAAGNVYVLDTVNTTIRKIVAATAAVTTLAGNAFIPGIEDGIGTAARFQSPFGAALDGAGNLYVAEGNSVIRKVAVANGAVTTFAGAAALPGGADGTGMAAQFRSASALAMDTQGSLFVADRENHTIRQISTTTGAVTTLAGKAFSSGSADGIGAAAAFSYPAGLVADGAGNLYVADSQNHKIRKIVIATGTVSSVAGAAGNPGTADGVLAAARFNSPSAVQMYQGDLYIVDSGNCTIRKIALATGNVSTIAGTAGSCMGQDGTGAAARFTAPLGAAVDSAGSLYVADIGGRTIRKVDIATGVVTTLAGATGMSGAVDGVGAAARFAGPYALLLDGTGGLLISDAGNQILRRLNLTTANVTTVLGVAGQRGVRLGALPGGLNTPTGMARLPNGGLALCNTGENIVLVVGGL